MAFKKRTPERFQNPDLRDWSKDNFGFRSVVDSGSGMAAGDLAEQTGSNMKTGTEQATAILGVVPSTVSASGASDVDFGAVNVKLGSTVAVLDKLAARENGRAGKVLAAQATIVNANAGGNFGNQPAGDSVTVASDNAADTQTCTIYGTVTGALTTVTSETITLTGVTPVATTTTTWEDILGIELGAAATGTITFTETSGGLTITTISAAASSAGVATLATDDAYGLVPRHDASGASTAAVGIIGTLTDGTSSSAVDALNGTTEEDHGTTAFDQITKVLIGAVASGVNVTVLTNESVDSINIGVALEAGAAGSTIKAFIKPYFYA